MADTTQTRFIRPRSGQFADAAPFCRFYFPMSQLSGAARDYMGGPSAEKNDAAYSDAEAWDANPGFLTTGPSITDYARRQPDPSHEIDLRGYAAFFTGRLKKLGTGVTEVIMGSYTAGTAFGGFQLTAHSSGALQMNVSPVDGSGQQTASISNTTGILDGNEHSFGFLFPPDFVSVKQMVDGAAVSTSAAGNASGKSCIGGNALLFGSALNPSAKVAAFADMALYLIRCDQGSAVRFDAISAFAHRNRGTPIPPWMFGVGY